MNVKKYALYIHRSPSNKFYVGISTNPERRWCNGNGYKRQTHFWNAIQKYGWDNFDHIILYTGLSKEDACHLQKRIIAILKSNQREYGYNITSGGEGHPGVGMFGSKNPMYGHVFTEQEKENLRNKMKGNTHSLGYKFTPEQLKHQSEASKLSHIVHKESYLGHPVSNLSKTMSSIKGGDPVLKLSKDGKILDWYQSTKYAAEMNNSQSNNIWDCAMHKKGFNTCKGYLWEFAKNYPTSQWYDLAVARMKSLAQEYDLDEGELISLIKTGGDEANG